MPAETERFRPAFRSLRSPNFERQLAKPPRTALLERQSVAERTPGGATSGHSTLLCLPIFQFENRHVAPAKHVTNAGRVEVLPAPPWQREPAVPRAKQSPRPALRPGGGQS